MGNHIIIRGFPLFGSPVILLLSVTLLCHCVNVLKVTKEILKIYIHYIYFVILQ